MIKISKADVINRISKAPLTRGTWVDVNDYGEDCFCAVGAVLVPEVTREGTFSQMELENLCRTACGFANFDSTLNLEEAEERVKQGNYLGGLVIAFEAGAFEDTGRSAAIAFVEKHFPEVLEIEP